MYNIDFFFCKNIASPKQNLQRSIEKYKFKNTYIFYDILFIILTIQKNNNL